MQFDEITQKYCVERQNSGPETQPLVSMGSGDEAQEGK